MDEIRFSTRSVSQRVLIWREIGPRFYPSNTKERHRYGGFGVPVRGCIMLSGRTELHILDRGSVPENSYCDEVLLTHVRLFRGAIGPDFICVDANTRPRRIDWPAYSPDLNLIEHV
ncbi:transposable element Tcb1 transposase [Trichonephila clavipes]|nr:transposable element Tcb1 transposase [Trichonephila clavipes]